jgi:hypothetical protein
VPILLQKSAVIAARLVPRSLGTVLIIRSLRTRTTLENFWRRVLRVPLLIKPRSKSPAEAGLKWLSMQKLRVNGITSPLTLCRWLAGDC